MKRSIQKAELACQQREAIKEELLRTDDVEEEKYQEQIEEIKQYIDKDKQVRDYLKTKQKMEEADIKEKNARLSTDAATLNERVNTEKSIRKKALEKANEISKNINLIINSEENPDGLPSTKDLKNLRDEKKAAASTEKGNKVLEDFQQAGKQNQYLEDFVKDVEEKVQQLDDEIDDIKLEILKYRGLVDSNDNSKKKLVEKLQAELKQVQTEEADYQHQIEDADKTINSLKLGIKSIYNRMGVDHEELRELLGSHGITESNMMQYLGVIENKTNELIETYQISKKGKNSDNSQTKVMSGGGPDRRQPRVPIQVNKNSLPDMNIPDAEIGQKTKIATMNGFLTEADFKALTEQ